MSNQIDEKVVEMRFDNRDFEKNVKTSMTTLDKLKQSLKFDKSVDSLSQINDAAKKVNFSPISDALETVKINFSALEVFAANVLWNISNTAFNAGKRIVNALTLEPVKTGFNEYEQKMDAVRVIMASTGESLDTVNKKIQELNKYADDTIYSFSDMTLNIGKFTNAGVKLDDAVAAIKGVSNEAARSGANANEASRAMYNFAQALSMGYVQLIDWKSIENANMATVEFKKELLDTAIATKKVTVSADGMYKAGKKTYNMQQMFKDGLKEQWLTSDILIETLKRYADTTTDIGRKAQDAATQVSTVSKLWDTLREAAQSGWGNTWEILIGDLEEAKKLLTGVSNVISGILDESSKARNDILREWKELGGRDDFIDAFRNIYKSISSLLKPIKEAFREIFPRITGKDLANLTKLFKDFTSKLILSDEASKNIKNTFKGLFSVLKVGINIIKAIATAFAKVLSTFSGLGTFISSITGAIGGWLINISDAIEKSNIFNNILTTITNTISNIINGIKTFASETLKINKIADVFSGIYNFIAKIASSITNVISDIISKGSLKSGVDVINSGIFGGILLGINSFIKTLRSFVKDAGESIASIGEILSSAKEILKAYQKEINSKILLNIAKAVGILAASLWLISTIDGESLTNALGGMSALIIEMMLALSAFLKITSNKDLMSKVGKGSAALISLSGAILILSFAFKILSTIDWAGMEVALTGMTAGLAAMLAAVFALPEKDVRKAANALKSIATALIIYSVAIKILSTIDFNSMMIALAGMTAGLAAMLATINAIDPKKAISKGFALIEVAHALILLSVSLKILSTIDWKHMLVSVTAIAACLTTMTVSLNMLSPEKAISKGFAFIEVAHALILLSASLKILSTIDWKHMLVSVAAIGAVLAEITFALNTMNGTISGAFALSLVMTSLLSLAFVMKVLGNMDLPSIGKAILALAGAFTVLGVAAAVLSPLTPVLLAISGSMALLGISVFTLGAGLTMIATAITALAVALSGGVNIIIAGLTSIILGIAKLIPELIRTAKDAIVALCETLMETSPLLVKTALTILGDIVKHLDEQLPMIVSTLIDFVIKILDALAERMPELMTSIIKVINAVAKGFKEAIEGLDPSIISGFISNIKSLSIIFILLAYLSNMIPSAMLGVLGFGALVTELGIVLAALGGLSKIPGLKDIIGEGGNFLEVIGIAIGKFVGGIIGGIAEGATSTLGKVGTNLSEFMENIKGFLNGISNVDDNILAKTTLLSAAIIELTASNLLNSISQLFGSNLPEMGKDLGDFMTNLKPFFDGVSALKTETLKSVYILSEILLKITESELLHSISSFIPGSSSFKDLAKGLEPLAEGVNNFINKLGDLSDKQIKSVTCACEILNALANIAKEIPNTGGLAALFSGDNDISKFGGKLSTLGTDLKEFKNNLGDFDEKNVETVQYMCQALRAIIDIAKDIPNTGGLAALFSGDNDISKFVGKFPDIGTNLKDYFTNIGDFGEKQVNIIKFMCDAITSVIDAANNIPNSGGIASWFSGDNDISKFISKFPKMGKNLKKFVDNLSGFDDSKVKIVKSAIDCIAGLAEAANKVPNMGGLVSWFTGDNDISKFSAKFPTLGKNLSKFIEKIENFGEAELNTVNFASQALASLAEAANKVPNMGGLVSWFTGDNDVSKFADKLPGLGTGLNGFITNIGKFGKEQLDTVTVGCDAFVKILDSLSNAENNGGLKSLSSDKDGLTNFSNQIPSLGTGLKGFINNIGTFSEEQLNIVNNVLEALKCISELSKLDLPSVTESINSFGNSLPLLGSNINSFISSLTDVGLDTIQESVSKVKEIIDMATSIAAVNIETVNTFGDSLVKIAEESVTGFCEAFSGMIPKQKVIDSVTEMMDAAIKAAKDKTDPMKEVFTTLSNDIINYINSRKPDMVSAGENFSDGFAEGIRNHASNAINAAIEMATNALNAAKQALDSHSPSKETHKIGNFFGEGFVIGIKDYFGKVYDVAYKSGNQAKEGLTDALNRISDTIEDDINTTPVIRPVLDLSDIENGSSKLGNILDSNSVGLNSVNSISNNFNSRNQNGYGLDLLNAINKLNSIMENGVGNTTTIYTQELDSAKLDQIVRHVDKAFGSIY